MVAVSIDSVSIDKIEAVAFFDCELVISAGLMHACIHTVRHASAGARSFERIMISFAYSHIRQVRVSGRRLLAMDSIRVSVSIKARSQAEAQDMVGKLSVDK